MVVKAESEYAHGGVAAFDGARAVAEAMRQINPDVVAAYPITPQTAIVEHFSQFVADGEVDTEFVAVESEHAAMSACIGASAAGGRAQTATAGAGLAFMWEVLWVAAGTRLPIVMHVVNRSLSAPLNIHCDHTDSMGARDAGWVHLFGENAQEAYDNAIQAVRIAEHADVMVPVLHTQDGFIISHGVERVEILPDNAVRRFVGTYEPQYALLDVDHPVTYGPMDFTDYFFEHKRQQAAALEKALEVIPAIGQEYGHSSGRYYGLVEPYRLDDADYAIVILGSTAGVVRLVVDELRDEGMRVGMLKVRCFRPFPAQAVAKALVSKKAIAVMDRSITFGGQGNPLFLEVCTSLFTNNLQPKAVNYVYGLGGRDTVPSHIRQVCDELMKLERTDTIDPVVRYLGVRD